MSIASVCPNVNLVVLGCAISLRQHSRERGQAPIYFPKVRCRDFLPLSLEWGFQLGPKYCELLLIQVELLSFRCEERVCLLNSSDTTIAGLRIVRPRVTLWRRSGGDRGIRRAGSRARDGTVGVAQYDGIIVQRVRTKSQRDERSFSEWRNCLLVVCYHAAIWIGQTSPISRALCFMVSYEIRTSEVGLSEVRTPQVSFNLQQLQTSIARLHAVFISDIRR